MSDVMKLNQITTRPANSSPVPLEEMLTELSRFGKPRLTHHGDGWYCTIEMHVSSKGVEFKVASEFKHETPSSAARECCERVVQTLRDIGA